MVNGTLRLVLLQRLGASFWFLPALVVLTSMAAAMLLVELDVAGGRELAEWSPRLFGASAEGSRAMLSAIATSMITVAGVVFSITVVVLSQTSSQYSPRVLRNFMRDRPTQAVLGVFVGVFAYCLVVLRTVRGEDDSGGFIPSLAVLGGMAYAFAGIAMLIYFIHHVSQSIQASAILQRIADDTRHAIDHLFPDQLAQEPDAAAAAGAAAPRAWTPIHAKRSGYVVAVDTRSLLELAREGRVVRLAPSVGDFVTEGTVLVELGGREPVTDATARRLRGCVQLDRQRTTEQDAGFGLQQLVDVAVKALSPGINDPTTATMCIDRLAALMARLALRRMPGSHRVENGRLLVIAPAPDFGPMLALAFEPLLAHCRGDAQVLLRLVQAVDVVQQATSDPGRRESLLRLLLAMRHELRGIRRSSQATAAREQARRLTAQLRNHREHG